MDDVLNQTDVVISTLNKLLFVKNMKLNRKFIQDEHLLNNGIDLKNKNIHSYIENQNMLDLYIIYMNKEINNLIDNKYCGK